MSTSYVQTLPTMPVTYKGYTYCIVGNPDVPTYHAQITKDDKTIPGPPSNSVVGANRKAREAIDKMVPILEVAPEPEPEKKKRGRPPKVVKFDIPAGTPPAKCSGCDAVIYWVVGSNGGNMPLDGDGQSHFATCPEAAKFKRGKKK